MAEKISCNVEWRQCSPMEFASLLKSYPRPLEIRTSIERVAQVREYCDPSRGPYPNDVVALANYSRPSSSFLIREDVEDWTLESCPTC